MDRIDPSGACPQGTESAVQKSVASMLRMDAGLFPAANRIKAGFEATIRFLMTAYQHAYSSLRSFSAAVA